MYVYFNLFIQKLNKNWPEMAQQMKCFIAASRCALFLFEYFALKTWLFHANILLRSLAFKFLLFFSSCADFLRAPIDDFPRAN